MPGSIIRCLRQFARARSIAGGFALDWRCRGSGRHSHGSRHIRSLTPVFAAEIAGILRDRIFHKMSPEDWSAVPGVHLTGYFNVARSAAAAKSARVGC